MNVLIAADSFKGSLGTLEAAACIKSGVLKVFPTARVDCVPVADGGEGTVQAVAAALGGESVSVRAAGPLGEPVTANYGLLRTGEAVVEMAQASGLTLVPAGRLDPMRATTYGTGELIRAALDSGCRRIYIGIGGSATNDGGAGMAQALGARFLDKNGRELPVGGGALGRLEQIDLRGMDPRLKQTEIIVLCDVDNPLCGPRGASAVFGPQKGATPQMVCLLDEDLRRLADVVCRQTGVDAAEIPGAGAAGGLGMGLIAFAGGKLRPGIDTVLDLCRFDEKLDRSDLVITGEGRMDGQTACGKAPAGIARRAQKHGVPVIAVVGSVGPGADDVYRQGIAGIFSAVCAPCTIDEAMLNAAENVSAAAERAMRSIRVGMCLRQAL